MTLVLSFFLIHFYFIPISVGRVVTEVMEVEESDSGVKLNFISKYIQIKIGVGMYVLFSDIIIIYAFLSIENL